MINSIILGTGSYLPESVVTNFDLESKLETTDEWIYSRTGIKRRHIANEKETTSYMAIQAAKNALASAQIPADAIDLILVATCTPNQIFPSMSCHVQYGIGSTRTVPAFDLHAACSGFIYALDVANQYIVNGRAKHVLVVGSETMSKAVDWTDRSTCVLFGDGAGAVVVGAHQGSSRVLGSSLHSAYDADIFLEYNNTTGNSNASFIKMQGAEVFKIAINRMSDIVDEVLEQSKVTKEDIKWLIPHQANTRIIQGIAKKLELPMSQVILTIDDQGNTSGASIPLALDHAVKQDLLRRGDLFLLESFGGGLTWGAMVLQY